ncbi:MAG TPA: WXG100 family type VII secretion target [Trebonia sp.]
MSGIAMPPGDPAGLEDAAGQLRSYGNQIATLADSTRSTSTRIAANADWTGSSADAYTGFTGSFAAGIGRMEEPLQNIPSAVSRYADALRTAQSKVSAYESHAKQVSTFVGPISAQERTTIDQASKTLEEEAESALDQLEAQAETAANALKSIGDTLKDVFGLDGSFRDWLETITRPWDSAGADAILEGIVQKGEKLEEAFNDAAKENQAALQEAITKDFDDIVGTVAQDYDAGNASLSDLESAYQTFEKASQTLTDASSAFAPEEGTLVKMLPYLKNVGRFADVAGIIGGTYTVIKPPDYDQGAARVGARAAGGAMALGSAAGLAGGFAAADGTILTATVAGSLTVPVLGECVAAGAGLYLVGDWAYHNTHLIAHTFDSVRHTAAHYADDLVSWM